MDGVVGGVVGVVLAEPEFSAGVFDSELLPDGIVTSASDPIGLI